MYVSKQTKRGLSICLTLAVLIFLAQFVTSYKVSTHQEQWGKTLVGKREKGGVFHVEIDDCLLSLF